MRVHRARARAHRRLLERFGGQEGVRALGLLDSTLHRARTGYYETLSEQAAALLQSLARNHLFVDGNKRVAFATYAVFLRILGGHAELAEIRDWLERGMRGITRPSGT